MSPELSVANSPPACLCTWAVSRFPHLARAAALVALALLGAAVANALNPEGIRWTLSPGGRVGIPRAFESRLPEISAAAAFTILKTHNSIFSDSRDETD